MMTIKMTFLVTLGPLSILFFHLMLTVASQMSQTKPRLSIDIKAKDSILA